MPRTVLITKQISDEQIARLRRSHCDREFIIHPCATVLEVEQKVREFAPTLDAMYTHWVPQDLSCARSLRLVQLNSSGAEHLSGCSILREERPWIANLRGINAVTMGEFIIAQAINLARRIDLMVLDQSRRHWDRAQRSVPRRLRGSIIGFVGYGSVARHTARLAKGFGMNIWACGRQAKPTVYADYLEPGTGDPDGSIPSRWFDPGTLIEMAAGCHYLVVTCPLDDSTRSLVDATILRAMSRESFLIHVSRGGIVNEADLVLALRDRRLAGAALDVFEDEPLPSNSPFYHLQNVLLTPHVCGWNSSEELFDLILPLFSENLHRLDRNLAPMNLYRKPLT